MRLTLSKQILLWLRGSSDMPSIVKVKQDFLLLPNLFESLPEFFQRPVLDVGFDCLPSRIHKNHSFTVPEENYHYLVPRLRMSSSGEMGDGVITLIAFLSPVQNDVPWFYLLQQSGMSLPGLEIVPKIRKNCFSLGFMLDCEALRNPLRAHLRISKISYDVT